MQYPDLIKSFPELISIQQQRPCDMILATLILKADFPSHSNGSRKCLGWIQKTAKPMHRTSCAAILSRGFFQPSSRHNSDIWMGSYSSRLLYAIQHSNTVLTDQPFSLTEPHLSRISTCWLFSFPIFPLFSYLMLSNGMLLSPVKYFLDCFLRGDIPSQHRTKEESTEVAFSTSRVEAAKGMTGFFFSPSVSALCMAQYTQEKKKKKKILSRMCSREKETTTKC